MIKKKVFTENVKDAYDQQASVRNNNKLPKPSTVNIIAKKTCTSAKVPADEVDSAKCANVVKNNETIPIANQSLARNQNSLNTKNTILEKIPALFSSKTPAQDRLNTFPRIVSTDVNGKSQQQALDVFHSGFGISSGAEPTVSGDNMDEEMEWEDCGDDATYSFQQLEDMVVEVLADTSNAAFIIPDTNVFLDSLAPIKCVMEKGAFFIFSR